jgi:signal transduction histidine kinase
MIQQGGFGEVPDSLQRPLRQMATSNQEMARLLNGLSALARLEDEARTVDRRPCSLEVLVREAVEAVLPEASMKAIDIVPQVDLNRSADVDGERLRIAIVNLLSNAIKYSGHGTRVEIRLRQEDGQAAISVADQGPGIAAGDESRVFDPYYRSERSRASGVPGTGLGLYLVRQIMELHGGEVALVNRPTGGAVFVLRLPLAQPGAGTT